MSQSLNAIPEKQNTEKFIEYLAAFSQLYSHAKRLAALQVIATVPVPIGLSVIAIWLPSFRVWAAFYGIIISILDLVLFDKLQADWKKEAAKIQECFDCGLFELDWRDFKVGDKPLPETISNAARKFLKDPNHREEIKNWYSSSVAKLPLYLARVVCQRSNIWWDAELRRVYVNWLIAILMVLVLSAVVVGIAMKMDMEAFVLSILAPIFPTIRWLFREIKTQRGSITTLDRLQKYVQDLWKRALDQTLTEEQINQKSRELQDELFVHRYSNQPIFNWLNSLLRKNLNLEMNVGAETLVEEALQALGKNQK